MVCSEEVGTNCTCHDVRMDGCMHGWMMTSISGCAEFLPTVVISPNVVRIHLECPRWAHFAHPFRPFLSICLGLNWNPCPRDPCEHWDSYVFRIGVRSNPHQIGALGPAILVGGIKLHRGIIMIMTWIHDLMLCSRILLWVHVSMNHSHLWNLEE